MSISTGEIQYALNEARRQIDIIENEAYKIGVLACDDSILRNMGHWQLKSLKSKLRNYNTRKGHWK